MLSTMPRNTTIVKHTSGPNPETKTNRHIFQEWCDDVGGSYATATKEGTLSVGESHCLFGVNEDERTFDSDIVIDERGEVQIADGEMINVDPHISGRVNPRRMYVNGRRLVIDTRHGRHMVEVD